MISARIRLLVLLVTGVVFAACGGSDTTGPGTTDPDPDPPADPVPASVEVTPSADSLSVGETLQLDAEVRDASGAVLAGEAVTWSSSDEAVATVSGSGEVTAAGDGAAEITATAGSVSGSADLSVFTAVAEIGDAGGTVASADGGATLAVPANALSSSTTITASPIESAVVAVGAVPGSAYEFGPDGLVFDTPATLTLAYEPDSLPAGADPATLVMVRSDGSTLERLQGVVVDAGASTVQAQVPGFSNFAICLPSEAALCGATPDLEVDLVVEDLFTVVGPDDGVSQATPTRAPVALYQGKLVDVRNDGTADATGVEIVFSTSGPLALDGLSLEYPEQNDPDEAIMACQDTGTNQDGAVTAITCSLPGIEAGASLFDAVQGEVLVNAVVPFGTTSLAVDVSASSGGTAEEVSPADNSLGLDFPYYDTPAADLVASLTAPAEAVEGQPWTLTFAVENTADAQAGPTVDGLDALIQLDGVNFGQDLPAGCGLDQDLGSLAAVRCRFDGLAAGDTRAFDFELGTGDATEIGATAVLQGWDRVVDTDPSNNGDQSVTAVGQPVTDVSASLVASRDPVEVGDTLTYTLTATNNGPDAVGTGTVVISASGPVDYPAGFQVPSGCATGSGGVGISCGFVNVPAGESREYSLQVRATGGGEINASAGLLDLASSTDPDPGNDIAEVVTTVTLPSVDLAYGVGRTPQDLQGGESATFTFSVTNPASLPVDGVRYVLNFFGDVTTSAGWAVPAGCVLGSDVEGTADAGLLCGPVEVPAGGSVSETISLDIAASETSLQLLGGIVDTGNVTDPEPTNNEVNEVLQVTPQPVETDLGIGYALDPAAPVAGGGLTATITLSNLGLEDAAGVRWAMNFNSGAILAPGYTVPSGCVLGSPADPSVDGVGLLCSDVAVPAGASVSETLSLELADTTTVLEITGDIIDFGGVIDTNAANDGVSDQVAIEPAPQDPLIVLDPDSVYFAGGPSETLPVQLVQVLNGGGGDLIGLDAGVSYLSGTGWLVASIGSENGQPVVALQADPSALSAGIYRADVSITDPQASNSPQILPVVLEVLPEADLGVALPNTPAEVEVGTSVEYQVSVTNDGPSATTGANVRLRVEGSLASPGSASIPSGCTLSSDATPSSTYDCALAGLAAGANVTLPLPLVAQVAGEELLATASVVEVSGAADPNGANDQVQAATTVTAPPGTDLQILADASSDITAGSSATVTFGVANLGTADAAGVTSVLSLVGDLGANAQWTVPAGCELQDDPLQLGAALSVACGPESVPAAGGPARDVVIDLAETATELRVVAEITSTGDVTDDNLTNNALDETFTVAPPPEPPVLALSQDSVSFDALVDGGPPSPQTVFISNDGGSTLTGLNADVTYDAGQPTGWLTANVQLQPAPGDPFLSLQVNQTGLALGTYTATVSVTATGATNNPQELRVVVHVLPPADIVMSVANVPASVDVGTTIDYEVTIANDGPSDTDSVIFQFVVLGTLLAPGGQPLPDGCGLFTSPPGAEPALLYQCTVTGLASGGSETFILPLIPQESGETLEGATSVANIEGAVDPNPLNDVVAVSTTVN